MTTELVMVAMEPDALEMKDKMFKDVARALK